MLGSIYHDRIVTLIDAIFTEEQEAIERAAALAAEAIAGGGVVHAFGSGHSAMVAKEITSRAGGLVPVNQIVDTMEGVSERLLGYAETILRPYEMQYEMRPGEAMIVISNSGINPLPIEVATGARARGLRTIGISNVAQSRSATSLHPSGKRLFEVVDVSLDTHAAPGDAAVTLPESNQRSGATSTIAGAFVANLLMLRTVELLLKRGVVPPVLMSKNLPGADENNARLVAAHRSRVRRPGA